MWPMNFSKICWWNGIRDPSCNPSKNKKQTIRALIMSYIWCIVLTAIIIMALSKNPNPINGMALWNATETKKLYRWVKRITRNLFLLKTDTHWWGKISHQQPSSVTTIRKESYVSTKIFKIFLQTLIHVTML